MSRCEYCDQGLPTVELKRQYIHRIGWRNVVCTEKGFHSEPGTWNDHSPRTGWVPRRLKKREWTS